MSRPPLVSVIIPCRNERKRIAGCLDSITRSGYPRDRLEVLVVDGRSEDGTQDIVASYSKAHPWIRFIDNPGRVTPAALNLGIAAARGDIIMRMDAHCDYPDSYIPRLVHWLSTTDADNVGGVCITAPASSSAIARAIAVGLSSPLGVGNSYFRIGTTVPREVDTVPFGCFRREIFARVGGFDEELVRNQDDEFNLRLRRVGGRILLVPDVSCTYYPRESLAALWRMFFQYGFFKPLVARKIGAITTLRQLVPPCFVATLACTGICGIWHTWAAALCGAVMILYAVFVAMAAGRATARHGLSCGAALMAVFTTMHVAYGYGFLLGAVRFLLLRRPAVAGQAVVLSR